MGLLANKKALEGIKEYLDAPDFVDNEIGHQLVMSFMPDGLDDEVYNSRYTFKLNNKIFTKQFDDVSMGGILIDVVGKLDEVINSSEPLPLIDTYKELGLIEDNRFSKEMIASIVANSIAVKPSKRTKKSGTTDSGSNELSEVFSEFSEENILHFLEQVDSYIPQ